MTRISRPNHTTVVAYLALFLVLGGTAYAVTLTRNSVKSKHIAKAAVKRSDVGRNAITSSKVGNGTLLQQDFAAGQLPRGEQGPQGSQGSQGIQGIQGERGPAGTVGQTTVQFTQHGADLGNGAEISIDAFCPAGQQGIGGGVRGDLTNSELTKVTASRPVIAPDNTGAPADDGTFTGWRGTFVNENNGAGIRPEVWVVCAQAP